MLFAGVCLMTDVPVHQHAGSLRLAVETMAQCPYPVPARRGDSCDHPECRFDCLGAGGEKRVRVEFIRKQLGQQSADFTSVGGGEVVNVPQSPCLLGQRIDHLGVAVAQRLSQRSGAQVQVLGSIRVDQHAASSVDEHPLTQGGVFGRSRCEMLGFARKQVQVLPTARHRVTGAIS